MSVSSLSPANEQPGSAGSRPCRRRRCRRRRSTAVGALEARWGRCNRRSAAWSTVPSPSLSRPSLHCGGSSLVVAVVGTRAAEVIDRASRPGRRRRCRCRPSIPRCRPRCRRPRRDAAGIARDSRSRRRRRCRARWRRRGLAAAASPRCCRSPSRSRGRREVDLAVAVVVDARPSTAAWRRRSISRGVGWRLAQPGIVGEVDLAVTVVVDVVLALRQRRRERLGVAGADPAHASEDEQRDHQPRQRRPTATTSSPDATRDSPLTSDERPGGSADTCS